jgi:hypothetical protein
MLPFASATDTPRYRRRADERHSLRVDVQSRTAVAYVRSYTQTMQTDYVKPALIAAWVLAVGAVGYVSGTTSVAGWIVAVLSLVVMVRLWNPPYPTMSETIRELLR